MSQPDYIPNFITCSCQHCNGHIKFDANLLRPKETMRVECPHCHLETILFRPVGSDKVLPDVKKSKSTRIELFLFELTRYPTVIVAVLILVALIVTAYLSLQALKPQKPLQPPVVAYESVAPLQENPIRNEIAVVPSGAKMASKNSFPQPVIDFLLKHVGFSLKQWLDQVKPEQRQAFLDNLAVILQTATAKNITDDQLKQVVNDFAESWITAVKYEADLQVKIAQEKQLRFMTLVYVGFGLMITLMILCLILVMLAIERNTRIFASQKPVS